MCERPVHTVKGPCAGCGEVVIADHGDHEHGFGHTRMVEEHGCGYDERRCRHICPIPVPVACGPVTPRAYVLGGSYPELNTPHPPTLPLGRNTPVHVVRSIGERLVLVRVLGMERTRGRGLDCCLVPSAELSAEPWGGAMAPSEPTAEPELERLRRLG